jgi:hypothetical protein
MGNNDSSNNVSVLHYVLYIKDHCKDVWLLTTLKFTIIHVDVLIKFSMNLCIIYSFCMICSAKKASRSQKAMKSMNFIRCKCSPTGRTIRSHIAI